MLTKQRPAEAGAGQRSGGCSERRAKGVRGAQQARSARVERSIIAVLSHPVESVVAGKPKKKGQQPWPWPTI